MSERTRTIAGAPQRTAAETTDLIVEMITETLEPAAVDDQAVQGELLNVTDALRMLVAGKYLASNPLILIAGPLTLKIAVAHGNDALTVNENLGKVPGAATATAWMLHLPASGPIAQWVTDATADSEHLTTDPPVASTVVASSAPFELANIDSDALRRAAGEAS